MRTASPAKTWTTGSLSPAPSAKACVSDSFQRITDITGAAAQIPVMRFMTGTELLAKGLAKRFLSILSYLFSSSLSRRFSCGKVSYEQKFPEKSRLRRGKPEKRERIKKAMAFPFSVNAETRARKIFWRWRLWLFPVCPRRIKSMEHAKGWQVKILDPGYFSKLLETNGSCWSKKGSHSLFQKINEEIKL